MKLPEGYKFDHIQEVIGMYGTDIVAEKQRLALEEHGMDSRALLKAGQDAAYLIFMVGLNLGVRRREEATKLLQRCEDSHVVHDHPIDDYCIPGSELDGVIQDIIARTEHLNTYCPIDHVKLVQAQLDAEEQ